MTHTLARISLSMALLLAATTLRAQNPPDDGIPRITLKTEPPHVRAGQEFELICRVSADDAQVLQVFLDCADSFGPEHRWKHDGEGVFETRVKHVEATPGPKEYELWAKIKRGEASRFAGESFLINVEEKEGDRELAAFLSWMKSMGYSDEVIQTYAYDGTKPVVREAWNRYFTMRKGDRDYPELETMPIVFVDVLATEDEATNEPLKGQTAALEAYMTRIYGKTFKISYLQQRVSYESLFGKPMLQKNAKGNQWLKFDPLKHRDYSRATAARIMEERQLPRNAVIIHWAAKKWKHEGDILKIQDLTGSSPANSGMGFNGFGLGTYAHEWGHGLGLGHMFVNGPGSYASRIWGLECIMNHTYVPYSNKEVGRLLSPLARYALEPKNGFLDQKTFASTYSDAMAGTEQLKRRLGETRTRATVASTMTWSTPWTPGSSDSVICSGLRNRSYEIQELELRPGIKPGSYSLLVGTAANSRRPSTLILKQDGRDIASTPVAFATKISETTSYTITIENQLSLTVRRSSRGSSNLYGIGELINEKPLVVPEK